MDRAKFDIGDDVYIITERRIYSEVPCELCEGKSTIKATIQGVERPVICPECLGRGKSGDNVTTLVQLKSEYKSRIDKRTIIEGIHQPLQIKYCINGPTVGKYNTWIDEEDIFFTKEEAEKECEKRNKEST